jgi:hypothetical protein
MGGEDYVEVVVVLKTVREKSILVSAAEDRTVQAWIGRNCIYGPDEQGLERLRTPQETTIRMFRWVAEKEGLI